MNHNLDHYERFTNLPPQFDTQTILSEADIENSSVSPISRISAGIYYKRSFLFIYGILTSVTLSLIIYDASIRETFSRKELEEPWFIAVDVACVLFLVLELTVRWLARSSLEKKFWTNPKNVLDVIVVILCILTLFPYAWIPQSEELAVATLCARYVAQLIRLGFFAHRIKSQHREMKCLDDTLIDLTPGTDQISALSQPIRTWSMSVVDDSGSSLKDIPITQIKPARIIKKDSISVNYNSGGGTLCSPSGMMESPPRAHKESIDSAQSESVFCVV